MNILVVDDNPVIAQLMRRTLEADGHTVASAHTLAGAQRAPGPFDLVVADVRLPNGDGRYLRETYPEVPFITMSGHLGEIPDLPKPFSPAQLRDVVRGVAGR